MSRDLFLTRQGSQQDRGLPLLPVLLQQRLEAGVVAEGDYSGKFIRLSKS